MYLKNTAKTRVGVDQTQWPEDHIEGLASHCHPGKNPFLSSLSSSSSPWSLLHSPLQGWPSLMHEPPKTRLMPRKGRFLVREECPTCGRSLGALCWVPAGPEGTGLWVGRGCHSSGGIWYSKSDSASLLGKGDGQD